MTKRLLLSALLMALSFQFAYSEEPVQENTEVQQYETAITPEVEATNEGLNIVEIETLADCAGGGGGMDECYPIDKNIYIFINLINNFF